MEIKHYFKTNPAPPEDILKLRDLIIRTEFDESFEWFAPYCTFGFIEKELVGAVVYGTYEAQDKIYPRFYHLILDSKIRGKKDSLKLVKASEDLMLAMGYAQIVLIQNHDLRRREMKRKLAVGFGYKHYARNEKAEYFCKNIEIKKRSRSSVMKEGGK